MIQITYIVYSLGKGQKSDLGHFLDYDDAASFAEERRQKAQIGFDIIIEPHYREDDSIILNWRR